MLARPLVVEPVHDLPVAGDPPRDALVVHPSGGRLRLVPVRGIEVGPVVVEAVHRPGALVGYLGDDVGGPLVRVEALASDVAPPVTEGLLLDGVFGYSPAGPVV